MTRQQLFAAFFFAVFLLLLYQFYRMFRGFLVPLTWAGLIALVFYPLHVRVTRLLKGRRSLAAFIFTTLVILVVIVPMVLLSILLANESVALYQHSTKVLRGDQLQGFLGRLQASTPGRAWEILLPVLEAWNVDIAGIALKATNAVSAFLMSQATGVAKNLATFVMDFFLTTFALFFFFRDGSRMIAGVRNLLPMEAQHKDMVFSRLYDTLSAVVYGTLATAAAQGLLAGLGFWALGVPFAVFLGCAAAFFSLLPFGAPVVWGLVAVYLGIIGSIGRALLLILWGTLVVGTVDNLLRPLIIGGRTEIPTILLFFGILGGLQAYGFLGVFLAPAVIAILVAFIRIYQEQYRTAG
ncbi:MAG: AI-2E family transporter [Candidatus Binatia bacterium]